jgi:glycerol-3-phosphate dehydrogenase (NAD(P)+)
MALARANPRYLPGIQFPSTLQIESGSLGGALGGPIPGSFQVQTQPQWLHEADLVVVATPMAGLRALLTQLRDCRAPVAWLCKGFEPPQKTGDSRRVADGPASASALASIPQLRDGSSPSPTHRIGC